MSRAIIWQFFFAFPRTQETVVGTFFATRAATGIRLGAGIASIEMLGLATLALNRIV